MADESKPRLCFCGQQFEDLHQFAGHTRACQAYRAVVRQARAKGQAPLLNIAEEPEAPPGGRGGDTPPAADKKDETPPAGGPGAGEGGEGVDLSYPPLGPERLIAILLTRGFGKQHATHIARSFANSRWAWDEPSRLYQFLGGFKEITPNIATAIASEYFGVAPFAQEWGGAPGLGPPGGGWGQGWGGGGQGLGGFPGGGAPPWWMWSWPQPPFRAYSQPAQGQEAAAQESVAAAAISTLGTVVSTAFQNQAQAGQGDSQSTVVQQIADRFNDRLEFQKAVRDQQEAFSKAISDLKDAQIQELRRQGELAQQRLQAIEGRDPLQEITSMRRALDQHAKEMGYAPPGEQDIYGTIGKGITELNETMRAGIGALAGRPQRPRSMAERREEAQQALQEEKVIARALRLAREAEESRLPGASPGQAPPRAQPGSPGGPGAAPAAPTPARPPAPATPPAAETGGPGEGAPADSPDQGDGEQR